ncbi:hypothetical protein ACFYYS_18795 [Streptomyces sp. NPDC002120]|uniref:hypothetical protein n=1 Tax=Streptomyces sp. NPDC002120 TaxID=3364631 RepID=UPI0036C487AD
MNLQPYAVRFSTPAAKVLAELPERAEEKVCDLLDAVICFANRELRHLPVLDIVWIGWIFAA